MNFDNPSRKNEDILRSSLKELVHHSVDDRYMQLKLVRKEHKVIDIWWIYDDGGIKMQYFTDYKHKTD